MQLLKLFRLELDVVFLSLRCDLSCLVAFTELHL